MSGAAHRPQADVDVETAVERTAAVVLHAHALAERMAALPVPRDPTARHAREERVRRLRAAVEAGRAVLSGELGHA